jgi:hypothetical protein
MLRQAAPSQTKAHVAKLSLADKEITEQLYQRYFCL